MAGACWWGSIRGGSLELRDGRFASAADLHIDLKRRVRKRVEVIPRLKSCIFFIVFCSISSWLAPRIFGSDRVVFSGWPEIRPQERSFQFTDAATAIADISILNSEGKPAYRLRCQPATMAPEDAVDLAGDFDCYLLSLYSQDLFQTLLTQDPFARLHDRGEIWAEYLVGRCGEYPEWGRVRTFRLRGMQITLTFSNVRVARKSRNDVNLLSFDFRVSVQPDASALSMISEPPPYAPPWALPNDLFSAQQHCGRVIRVHVPGDVSMEYIEQNHLEGPYPAVRASRQTIQVRPHEPKNTPISLFILPEVPVPVADRAVSFSINGLKGNVEYRFECSADSAGPPPFAIQDEGLLCGLFSADGNPKNLLKDSVDPYSLMSEAQVTPIELFGTCANYSQWGSEREFSLRGFDLSLRFSNPVFEPGLQSPHALRQVDLEIEVRPNPTANAPVASPPDYIHWNLNDHGDQCERILISPKSPAAARRRP